jgi:hypothetical protein
MQSKINGTIVLYISADSVVEAISNILSTAVVVAMIVHIKQCVFQAAIHVAPKTESLYRA